MLTTTTFERVEMPEGPQPLPAWVKGAHVDWMDGYGNCPSIRIKTAGEGRTWTGQTWRRFEDGRYTAEHPDGRSHTWYHRGDVGRVTLRRARSDGQPGLEDYEAWATSVQDGLGGSHIHCLMAEGEEHAGEVVVLRGPWHSAPPPETVEVAYTDITADSFTRYHRAGRPWHLTGGMAGLCLSEDLFLRIVARYLPHIWIARTIPYPGSLPRLQPVRPEWSVPKTVHNARKSALYTARRAAEDRARDAENRALGAPYHAAVAGL